MLWNIDLGAKQWVLQYAHGEKCVCPLFACMVELARQPNSTSHWPRTQASSNKQSGARGCPPPFLMFSCETV